MTILFQLAQINTGNATVDYLANQVLPIVGPLGLIILGIVLLAGYVIKVTTDARVTRNTQDVRQQAIVNDLAERLPKLEVEIREEQKARYIAEGRVNELSTMLRHDRDKYEAREKAWEAEKADFKSELERLSKQYEALKEEHNGKTALIASQDLEITQLNSQLHDEQSKNTRLENTLKEVTVERDNLKKTVSEQAEQIISLANQLVLVDPAKSGDTDKMKAVSVTTTTTTEISDGTKEFSQLSDKDNPS